EVKGREASLRGNPVRLASVRDISEQKRLEETRERIIVQERAAREEAERAIRLRDDFLAIASHELKTPLTPLKMELQLVRRYLAESVTERTRKTELLTHPVNLAETESDRLGRLIADLLDVARISAGRLELKKENCDLADIVRRATERLALQFA